MGERNQSVAFSGVSRYKGWVFSTLAKIASWIGIVILALLLATVVIDAFGLDTASLDWYAGILLGFGIPVLLYAAYIHFRRPVARLVAAKSLSLTAAGLFMTVGVFLLFVIVEPYQWFFSYTLGVFPAVIVARIFRQRSEGRASLMGTLLGAVGIGLSIPIVNWVPVYPLPWMTYLWTLVVPIGFLLAWQHGAGVRKYQVGIVSSVVAGGLLVTLGVPLVAPISPEITALLYVALVLPTARYAGIVSQRKREAWPGLLSPLVLVFAGAVGLVLARAIGTSGPSVWLDWQFLTSAPSTFPDQAGLYPAIVGSVFIIVIVAIVSFVVGVGAAIYLEEYAPSTGIEGTVVRVIRVNIANLAGVPSVVYGLLGLGLFVNLLGMGLGIVIVAALTLSLLILPIVIISAQEALRSVPTEVREASFGMGATQWQTIRNVVLPRAIPGILTGTILALSRAIGETAPLLMIGAATTVFSPPEALTSQVSAMPLQVFYWSFAAKSSFREFVAPAGVVTLLVVMLSMNAVAIYLRNRYEQQT